MPVPDGPSSGLSSVVSAPFATDSSLVTAAPSRRPNFQFDLSDIEKAHSISYVSRLHKVPRSPLDPIYHLPRVIERPVTPPRFLRDSMDVTDIERTRPKDHFTTFETRTQAASLNCKDIQGTIPVARYEKKVRPSTSLNAKDITHTRFVSSRHTDPLDPQYVFGRQSSLDVSSILSRVVSSDDSKTSSSSTSDDLVLLGSPDGCKSRPSMKVRSEENRMNLRTHDICSKEAREWSWTKPVRTLVRTIQTDDVPGAQCRADQARIYRTRRCTDPNMRDYGLGLGGRQVSDGAGMVHVHRHVLDDTPFASICRKGPYGEPSSDAAGISLWKNGTFTAGSQPPRQIKTAFGAPATEETNTTYETGKQYKLQQQPQKQQPQQQQSYSYEEKEQSSPHVPIVSRQSPPVRPASGSSVPSSLQSTVSSSAPYAAAATAVDDGASVDSTSDRLVATDDGSRAIDSNTFLSYPPDTRKVPIPQKRHKHAMPAASCVFGGSHSGGVGVVNGAAGSNLLVSPPSNGKECVAVDPSTRVPTMVFGVRAPFSVSVEKSTIEESQTASATMAGPGSNSRTNSRPNSRPISRTSGHTLQRPQSSNTLQNGNTNNGNMNVSQPPTLTQKRLFMNMSDYSPTASTLSNAFSMAFVPTSTTTLPRTLPFSSPVSRPGLGTIELFERKPIQGGARQATQANQIIRAQERKAELMRTKEIQAVRALA